MVDPTAFALKAVTMGDLFDNRAKTRAPKLPLDVVRELVSYGVPIFEVRRMHPRVAFARLYQFRERGLTVTEERTLRERHRLAKLLRSFAQESEPCPRELTNGALEALSILPVPLLKRVCAGLANVLEEHDKPAA